MKRCQFCGEPSTIHLTEIREQSRKQMHLCERCGVERKLISAAAPAQLNLPEMLKLLLGELASAAKTPKSEAHTALTCTACGLKYTQFRTAGRFGCPGDYETFREPLEPLLERIHRGLEHQGKTPRRLQTEADLDSRLRAAIEAENYELAARLRDELRRKEATTG